MKSNIPSSYFFPDAAPINELPAASAILQRKEPCLVIHFDLPYLPLGFHADLVCGLFGTHGIDDAKNVWRKGFILRKNNSSAVVHYLSRKSMIEIVLSSNTDTIDYQDFAKLLKNILIESEKVLPKGGIFGEEQIEPFVLMNKQTFAVHSAQDLVKVLGNIDSFDQLFEKVREMASKINIQNGSYTGDNSQSANNSNNVQQNNNSDNTNIEINADQREQTVAEALKKTDKPKKDYNKFMLLVAVLTLLVTLIGIFAQFG